MKSSLPLHGSDKISLFTSGDQTVTPDGKIVATKMRQGFSGHEIDRIPVQDGAAPLVKTR